jgi:probable F420-dependent oxidoreductase
MLKSTGWHKLSMPTFDFGVHYSCQSPDGDWGSVYQKTVEQARVAESLGYSSFSVAEHHFFEDGWVPAPTVVLGAIAGVTEAASVGTNVTVLPLHDPVKVAERAAVLDLLTDGNFRLGVSIGWEQQEFKGFGIDRRTRVARLEEGVTLVRRLLTERSVTHDGEFYSVEDMTVTPRPIQESIPIWIGGMAEPAIRRAAGLGDVWSISPFESPAELAERVETYRDALSEHGRAYEDVHVPLRREAYVAEDDDTAWEEAGKALFREHAEVYDEIEDTASIEGSDGGIEALREYASDRFLVGSPETVVGQLEDFYDAAEIDEVLIRTHFPGLEMEKAEQSLRLIAEEVMPHFE